MSTEQMGIEVAVQGENLPAQSDGQITSLMELAIREKVDVGVLERLVGLQERVAARNAEMAMAEALAAFQDACPPIGRTRTAKVNKRDGSPAYSYKFTPLEDIVRIVRPLLMEHGLSFTHDGSVENGNVTTVCTLHHVEGATRTATFTGPIDNSGGKNPLQGVGSARSYGRRYTLIDVLGLITEDDDDGRRTEPADVPRVTKEQAVGLEEIADEAGVDKREFLAWLNEASQVKVEAFADIAARDYGRAKRVLDKRLQKARAAR